MKRSKNGSILNYFTKQVGTSPRTPGSSQESVEGDAGSAKKRKSNASSACPLAEQNKTPEVTLNSPVKRHTSSTPKVLFSGHTTAATPFLNGSNKKEGKEIPSGLDDSNPEVEEGEQDEQSSASSSCSPTNTPKSGSKKSSNKVAFRKEHRGQGDENESSYSGDVSGTKDWPHLSDEAFSFARPENRRDAKRRRPYDLDYDSRTMCVPQDFFNTQTPGHKQWWKFKSQYFESVLFFKVGKFYELYHWDAVIGVERFGLNFMGGTIAHSGFPEVAFEKFRDLFVEAGLSVVRIEQTETTEAREARLKEAKSNKLGKQDNVVRREVCRIDTIATLERSGLDSGLETPTYLIALTLLTKSSENNLKLTEFGVCFIDCTTSKVHLAQFSDDRNCSRLRTLIARYPPASVLVERRVVTPEVIRLLKCSLITDALEQVKFPEASGTMKLLNDKNYFASEDGKTCWPKVFEKVISPTDVLGLSVKPEFALAVKCLGAIAEELMRCVIDEEKLSLGNFELYSPEDCEQGETVLLPAKARAMAKHMVLDSVTLTNLEVLKSGGEGEVGSLLETISFCSTNFGKRLFRLWVTSPLTDVSAINTRLDAVDDLSAFVREKNALLALLKDLPDLERQLAVIHKQGHAGRGLNHPESRAVMFCQTELDKKKINAFSQVIDGFKGAVRVIEAMRNDVKKFSSVLLRKTLTFQSEGGAFPNIQDMVAKFENSFDRNLAKKEGLMIPARGVVPAYDKALDKVEAIEQKFSDHLSAQCKHFKATCKYAKQGKNRYLLEVPIINAKQYETQDHQFQGANKSVRRYYTEEIQNLLAQLVPAEETKTVVLNDIMRQVFESFSSHYKKWSDAAKCLATFDCLLSLAKYKNSISGESCRPMFVADGSEPFIEVLEGSHPVLAKHKENLIPNDTKLTASQLVLLTGANMSGKSTLMREIGLLVLLAQVGSYVPAVQCKLSPVDRIFTRLGASDRLVEGESTFFVECDETATILRHATCNSLVLLDELGRGTSTYDGTAIAYSVVERLSSKVQCRTLFSTHYHSLVKEFANTRSVGSYHMSCLVENENINDPTMETVTFLYKLSEGDAPKSYGFNVARLAGISDSIVRRGYEKAQMAEKEVTAKRTVQRLRRGNLSTSEMRSMVKLLKSLIV